MGNRGGFQKKHVSMSYRKQYINLMDNLVTALLLDESSQYEERTRELAMELEDRSCFKERQFIASLSARPCLPR